MCGLGCLDCFIQKFKNPVFNKMAFVPCILMSAIYHEYVLWAPLRFVLPVLLLQYSTFGRESHTLTPHTHTPSHTPIHTHPHTSHTHTLTHTHTHTPSHLTHPHTHSYTHTSHTHPHTPSDTHTHTLTHTHTHTPSHLTHTHTHSPV